MHLRDAKGKWFREDNKNVAYYFFSSQLTQMGHNEMMIEMWSEYAKTCADKGLLTR